MAYRLAQQCGIWDVDALMDELPMSALAEWAAFYRLQGGPVEGQPEPKKGDWKTNQAMFRARFRRREDG